MKKGFTLAEVLITIGIIGIVMAMTLPILIGKYQEFLCHTKWKSVYSKISNAYLMVKSNKSISDSDEMFLSNYEMVDVVNSMKDILKVKTGKFQNQCGEGQDCSNGGGSIDTYKTMFGSGMNPYSFGGYNELAGNSNKTTIWYLPEGATVYFRLNTSLDMFVIYMFVDVNGINSPPNILGKDFFSLVITPKGSCPIGANCGYRPQYFKNSCTSDREIYATASNGMHHNSPISGIGCSAEVLLK